MKKIFLFSSLAVLGFALNASAQRDTARVDSARAAVDQTREYRGDSDFRQDRELGRENARAGYEIDRLNSEVRELRHLVRTSRSYHIRDQFENLQRDTDRLTALYRRNKLRSSDVRHRAIELRRDASHLRSMLHHGWR